MASLKRVIQVTFQDDGGLERHIRQVKQSKQEAAGLGPRRRHVQVISSDNCPLRK